MRRVSSHEDARERQRVCVLHLSSRTKYQFYLISLYFTEKCRGCCDYPVKIS